jgi:hypothetical protein
VEGRGWRTGRECVVSTVYCLITTAAIVIVIVSATANEMKCCATLFHFYCSDDISCYWCCLLLVIVVVCVTAIATATATIAAGLPHPIHLFNSSLSSLRIPFRSIRPSSWLPSTLFLFFPLSNPFPSPATSVNCWRAALSRNQVAIRAAWVRAILLETVGVKAKAVVENEVEVEVEAQGGIHHTVIPLHQNQSARIHSLSLASQQQQKQQQQQQQQQKCQWRTAPYLGPIQGSKSKPRGRAPQRMLVQSPRQMWRQ